MAGLRIGADDFLAKPFAEAEILARCAAMLRIKLLQDQLRSAQSQLEELSVTDGLTGLYKNRRFFDERLREEFRRAQRYSDPVSLIMMDLDHFKDVNDRYGHPFGDGVLRETAELLTTNVREPDICSRYGGEEFAVILPKTHLQGALAVAERICKALRHEDLSTRVGGRVGHGLHHPRHRVGGARLLPVEGHHHPRAADAVRRRGALPRKARGPRTRFASIRRSRIGTTLARVDPCWATRVRQDPQGGWRTRVRLAPVSRPE